MANEVTKQHSNPLRQCLTPLANAAIIAALIQAEAQEKKRAWRVTKLQFLVTIFAASMAYGSGATPQSVIAVLSGGGVSVLNSALMAWRMSRVSQHTAHDAQHQLRLMYFYAAERFLVVVSSLGVAMATLDSPFAVLGGFITGQTALMLARLFMNIKTEDSDQENV